MGVFVDEVNLAQNETVTLRIHEFDESATNDLGSLETNLNAQDPAAGTINDFMAPRGATLDPRPEYILNFHSTGNASNDLQVGTVMDNGQMGTRVGSSRTRPGSTARQPLPEPPS